MPTVASLLTPWLKQPVGLFSNVHYALISFPTYFTEDMGPEERKVALQGFNTMACWIASAKQLTPEVRSLFINASCAWGDGILSKKEVIAFIKEASEMGPTEALVWMDKLRNLPTLSGHLRKPLLYYAMSVAGCDGLQPQELERLLWVANEYGVSENDMSELIGMFYSERNLIREMNKHFLPQSKL